MPYKQLTISQMRDLINSGEVKDPLVFLESIMNGQDPRKVSGIYKLILDINDFSDGDISREDWTEVVDYVISNFKYSTVSISESINAAKTLAEYLHPKRKQIEKVDGASGTSVAGKLTEEEIELFKEKFNDEF